MPLLAHPPVAGESAVSVQPARETCDLHDFTQKRTGLGVALVALNFAALGLLMAGALALPWLALQAACASLAGVAIATLFVIGHDCGHNSLTASRRLNSLLGHLTLLPAFHPYSLWVLIHNLTHHRWANLSPKDYVWTPLSRDEYAALSPWGRWTYRVFRGPLGQFVYYFCDFWLRRMIFPTKKALRGRYKLEYVLDWLLVVAAMIGWTALLVVGAQRGWFGGSPRPVWNALLFGLVLPQAVWNTLMSTVIYLHHTHPELRWYNDEDYWEKYVSQADTSVHVIFPGPVNMIFHWIMEHNAHHARPGIPLYNLPAAQRFLEHQSQSRVIVFRWTPWSHLDVIRRCKLYDYDRGCWTDFAGRDTSTPQIVLAPPHGRLDAPHVGEFAGTSYEPEASARELVDE
jgi:omega-6 fatty acid desaturase (delta-12 desaturase)